MRVGGRWVKDRRVGGRKVGRGRVKWQKKKEMERKRRQSNVGL